MLPCSHVVPINKDPLKSRPSPQLLADSFSAFISASSLLEGSYRDLQREVGHLGTELAERNAALTRSLAENETMRGVLQQVIDSMPCGVLVLDAAESIVTINPEGRRLLEIGNSQAQTLREVAALSSVDFERLAVGVAEPVEHEVSFALGDRKRWLAISKRTLSSASIKPAFVPGKCGLRSIWILRDVTATKEAEREREAARSAMALAEVSAVLAHEIRNPLASMELFAGLLVDEPEQTELWVSHLRAGIRLLSATVNNVLNLQGGSSVALMPIKLSECVRDGVEFVRPIAEQAGIVLSFRCEEELTISASRNQLRQVLLNLICNAIRHTPTGGVVAITVRGAGAKSSLRAVVAVSDTGCGIAEQMIGRVFEAGFSEHGDTPGLGLAVCKRIVEGHNGEIRVRNRTQCGTTFEMEFPTL